MTGPKEPMNEARRQFALGVAGVRLWYARSPLPGAALTPDLDFPEPPAEPTVARAAVASPSARGGESRHGLAHLQEILAGARKEQASPVEGKAEPAQSPSDPVDAKADPGPVTSVIRKPKASVGTESLADPDPAPLADGLKGQEVEFHWCFWVGKSWVLVNARSEAAGQALEDNLARNILKALSDSAERFEEVRWPVFSNPAVPGNDAAGAADLLAELGASLGNRRRLCLGLLPDEPGDGELLFRVLMESLGEVTVQSPMSLAALASDPAAKRDLWRALKAAVLK